MAEPQRIKPANGCDLTTFGDHLRELQMQEQPDAESLQRNVSAIEHRI